MVGDISNSLTSLTLCNAEGVIALSDCIGIHCLSSFLVLYLGTTLAPRWSFVKFWGYEVGHIIC
jgi:hypothetical protein